MLCFQNTIFIHFVAMKVDLCGIRVLILRFLDYLNSRVIFKLTQIKTCLQTYFCSNDKICTVNLEGRIDPPVNDCCQRADPFILILRPFCPPIINGYDQKSRFESFCHFIMCHL